MKHQFTDMGLIHLMVVSGGHLWFWLRWFKAPTRRGVFMICFLVLFCLSTRMQPPVVRASSQILMSAFCLKQKLFWRRDQQVFCAGALTWLLLPDSSGSLSLMLSWAASLALCLGRDRLWVQCLWAYVFLFPITLVLGANSPASILFNVALGPLLSLFLYPLSFFSLFFSLLSSPLNLIWQAIEVGLSSLQPVIPSREAPLPLDARWGWLYLGFLHLVFLLWPHKNSKGKED